LSYITKTEVRTLTNLTTSDITDDDLSAIIELATDYLNSDIQIEVVREKIEYIDKTRENKIDGSNTTYYIKDWKNYVIGDGDNDGEVDTNDITVYAVHTDGTETEATVSSITPDSGKFELDTAYSSSYDLYLSYYKSPVSMDTPHALVKLACTQLTAALSYAKINLGKAPKFKAGNTQILRDMDSYQKYLNLYQTTIDKIRDLVGIKEVEGII
jgi:hypothetical protein